MQNTAVSFKETSDNWHANYEGDKVRVKLHGNVTAYADTANYKVSVTGTDNYGYEFISTNEAECIAAYETILAMQTVTVEAVKALGFDFI